MIYERFTKSFTQQEPIPTTAINEVVKVLESGRLHRYNTIDDKPSQVSLLEQEFSHYQHTPYCLAVASCGYALYIALCACGIQRGDRILINAWTLSPVPGAIHNAGAIPTFVEIDDNWNIDIDDLYTKAKESKAKFLLLSHMRGHIANMDKISQICDSFGITLIEDCAHTMGAKWGGIPSGNFGKVACFSTQTYKHINSGEGGLITTSDEQIIAKLVIYSGSYKFYNRHISIPCIQYLDEIYNYIPNYSGRMDNVRATILRPQISLLSTKINQWNKLYNIIAKELVYNKHIHLPYRLPQEEFVGSSIQFQIINKSTKDIHLFLQKCANRGIEIKWFGEDKPIGFTSRYDSWEYLFNKQNLPYTNYILSQTFDMRISLIFDEQDCKIITAIIVDEIDKLYS